jgi:uncharacterized protein YjbJ (UPF0337 family)
VQAQLCLRDRAAEAKSNVAINWNCVERDWKELKAEVGANWNRLTREQLTSISGSRMRLATAITQAYGITGDAAERQIRNFEDRNQEPRIVSLR